MDMKSFAALLREEARRVVREAEQKADVLAKAASVLEGNAASSMGSTEAALVASLGAKRTATRGSRLEELKGFLRKSGPLKRAEIIAKSGLPKGTIASLLAKKDHFKVRKSKWSVKENERKAD